MRAQISQENYRQHGLSWQTHLGLDCPFDMEMNTCILFSATWNKFLLRTYKVKTTTEVPLSIDKVLLWCDLFVDTMPHTLWTTTLWQKHFEIPWIFLIDWIFFSRFVYALLIWQGISCATPRKWNSLVHSTLFLSECTINSGTLGHLLPESMAWWRHETANLTLPFAKTWQVCSGVVGRRRPHTLWHVTIFHLQYWSLKSETHFQTICKIIVRFKWPASSCYL